MILIASYPKSGNTWVRALLTAYFAPDQSVDIKKLWGKPNLTNRSAFDDQMAVDSADLPAETVLKLRTRYCIELARTQHPTHFVKVHDAYTLTQDGTPIFPNAAINGVVYVVRNPLNIAPSYANHQDWSLDQIIDFMLDRDARLYYQNHFSFAQLEQRLGDWAHHVNSWRRQTALPITLIKYEDLCDDPAQALSKIITAFAITPNPDKIDRAVDACALTALKDQEKAGGFGERNPRTKRFFDKGADRNWMTELTKDQANRIQSAFPQTMTDLGYA